MLEKNFFLRRQPTCPRLTPEPDYNYKLSSHPSRENEGREGGVGVGGQGSVARTCFLRRNDDWLLNATHKRFERRNHKTEARKMVVSMCNSEHVFLHLWKQWNGRHCRKTRCTVHELVFQAIPSWLGRVSRCMLHNEGRWQYRLRLCGQNLEASCIE